MVWTHEDRQFDLGQQRAYRIRADCWLAGWHQHTWMEGTDWHDTQQAHTVDSDIEMA